MPWSFEVEMINKIIKSTPLKIFLLTYLTVILVLYPVSRMYANEYETVPIKFEFAFFMLAVGFMSNTGNFLVLTDWGLKHTKTTCASLIFSALMNAFLLLITNGNPFQFIANEYWNTVRYSCFYAFLVLGVLLCAFVGGYRHES